MATQFLKTDGGTLAFDDAGRGPLVLCAPSMGDVRAEYRFLAPRLVEAGYRVVTMDLRGLGEASVNWPDYTVGAFGSDMLAIIKHLNAGPALLVGESMAAGGAVWAAAEAPELVAGIVLIGPFVRVMSTGWQARLLSMLFAVLVAPLWGVAFWRSYYKRLYPTTRPADFDAYLSALTRNLKEPGRLSALRAMLRDNKAASDARLSRVLVPVHILMGTRDPDFKQPEQEVQILVGRLQGTAVTSQMIEGAGHYPHAEMPEQAASSIRLFFNAIQERVAHGN
jgi:pimeloyl-ACP methyl ester carboxylesterase